MTQAVAAGSAGGAAVRERQSEVRGSHARDRIRALVVRKFGELATDRSVWFLVAISVVSGLGLAASPWLLDLPLLLVVFTPRLPFLTLAAADSPLTLFIVIAVARMCLGDPLWFRLGRRHGAVIRDRVERQRPSVRWLANRSTLVLVGLRPISRHVALAAATGSRTVHVALVDLASTTVYTFGIWTTARVVAG